MGGEDTLASAGGKMMPEELAALLPGECRIGHLDPESQRALGLEAGINAGELHEGPEKQTRP